MEALQNLQVPWAQTGQQLLRLSATAFSLVVIALASSFVYNVYFHPLSSYPGPKIWAGTRLVSFWHATRGNLIHKVSEFHEQYGPVVRVGPSELSYITASAWKTIYGHRSVEMDKAVDGRSPIVPPPTGVHSILTADRENHSRMRRNVAHAFSEKALREQESYIQMYVTQLVEGIRRQSASGEPVDLVQWYNFCTFDLIGDLAFGEPFGCLKGSTFHSWITTIMQALDSTPWVQLTLYYGISKRILSYIIPKEMATARARNYQISGEKMDRRMASTEDRKDFTSYMLKHTDEKGLTVQELRSMSTVLIIAGSETTATLLSGATYHLLSNLDVYERLTREVRERFTKEEDITLVAVNDLKYMLAVLDEGLRIYPPVAGSLPRRVPKGGEEIDGKWVPESTAVGVHNLASYRSEKNFFRASEFLPERWLGESDGGSPEFADDNKAVFQPFSFGPRNCIGRNLAYAEMRVIMARVLFNFDLELEQSSRSWDNQTAPLLWNKPPLMVRVVPRQK